MLARFSDGETIQADLLVGADGTRSTVRQQALPEAVPLYAGYCAWRALIAESALPPDVHRELFDFMSFTLPPGEQLLGYPVAGPDNDLRPEMCIRDSRRISPPARWSILTKRRRARIKNRSHLETD